MTSLELMRRMARTPPDATLMCAFEVEENLAAGRLAFVSIQGSPARQSVALVHCAAGPLAPLVSAVAAYLGTALVPRPDEG